MKIIFSFLQTTIVANSRFPVAKAGVTGEEKMNNILTAQLYKKRSNSFFFLLLINIRKRMAAQPSFFYLAAGIQASKKRKQST